MELELERHHHEDHHGDGSEGSPVVAKSVAMAVLFLASFTIGCIPLKLAKIFDWKTNPKNNTVVQLLLCFGGGVLLCTTFLHLLPEVAEGIQELQEEGQIPDLQIHLAEFLMCSGFFLMYLVEELVHAYLHMREKNAELSVIRRSLSIRRGEINSTTVSTTDLVVEDKTNPLDFQAHSDHHNHHHNHSHGHSHVIIEDSEDSIVKSLRGLLIVLALSVHELFEGLSVGLESSPASVWYMFGAVSAHKLVIAFCIGVELVSAKTKTLFVVIYVFMFAVVSPMGIGIGIAISGNGDGDNAAISSVILQGLASGTLLYVVFFEILQKDNHGGLKKYLAIFAGFLIMFGITFIGAHDHNHNHKHVQVPSVGGDLHDH